MKIVALTGSAASGKSAVAAWFRAWGTPVFDADQVVHALQQPGEPIHQAIVSRFGTSMLQPDGTLDRPSLRRLILTDPLARRDLEALVHPAVEAQRQEWIAAQRRLGEPLIVAEIPLLFEAGNPAGYDGVIVVDAPDAIRRQRLIRQRGFSKEDADRMLAAQTSSPLKRARATWIIENDADLATLEQRARLLWEALPR